LNEEDQTHFTTTGNFPTAIDDKHQTQFENMIKEEQDDLDQPEESIDFVFNARNHRTKVKKAA